MSGRRTEHGFRLGAIEVIAAASLKRGDAVIVRIGDAEVEVIATPAGGRVYIHVKNGRSTTMEIRYSPAPSEVEG